ncbi:MAG: aldo/keto reductase [Chloroflexi bacterium]|nr:aldo/keto reductase [Chloroflexota bacterium]
MEYQPLNGTGAIVSRVSLGTMTFGHETDEPTSIRMVDIALDAGINWIDTANAYSRGRSEEILGKALQGKRDRVVLASKVANLVGPDPRRDQGLHRWHILRAVEDSLRRLNTDRLDILYMHRPDHVTPIEETLAAIDTLVRQGKVIYVGMSNFAAWQLCEAKLKAEFHGWAKPVVTQVPYNLITRSIDAECVPFCREHNMAITCYNPLAAGLLTGKHRGAGAPSEHTRFAESEQYYRRYWHEANFKAVDRLAEIAEQAGKTLIELSLQWLLSQPHVTSVILGARTIEHLESNLKAIEGRLDQATLAACDEVWEGLRGVHFSYIR